MIIVLFRTLCDLGIELLILVFQLNVFVFKSFADALSRRRFQNGSSAQTFETWRHFRKRVEDMLGPQQRCANWHSTRGSAGKRLVRIVLTGGPCGGKSSVLEQLRAQQVDGATVFCVPEVPTLVFTNGPRYPGSEAADDASETLLEFEANLMRLQLAAEDAFVGMALLESKRVVLVYDRAALDIKAYMPDGLWRQLLASNGWSESALLARYDAVVHLTSAAVGPTRDAYTTANNAARTETADKAAELDRRVKRCWQQHPRLHVVANAGDFAAKLAAAHGCIRGIIDDQQLTPPLD
eukprot:TRINITY_DN1492_c1_g1_i1.p2 TRINITY_DN1492_c1_g1~~TRINITY_DN1492_c1_g1_i1.p2  ORF type:complete len:305 (-),score=86.97 TRINITY_DN1492_c1_g1_i1:274-1158(-)